MRPESSSSAIKIQNTSIRNRMEVFRNSYEGIQSFDLDNAYPQRCLRIVRSSGTASNCVKILAKYIRGRGWSEESYNTLIVNRNKETLNDILRKVSLDFAYHNGIVLHFNYNGLGQIVEIWHIPFEYARKGLEDDIFYSSKIAISRNWEKRNLTKNQKPDFIDIFNPDPEIVLKQIENTKGGISNYKGQILYLSNESNDYPLAPYDSVIEDILTDAQIKVFKMKSITTGFMASTLMTVIGAFERDEDGHSDVEEKIVKKLNNFQGAKNAGNILLMAADTEEEIPDIKNLTLPNSDKLFEYTEISGKNQIVENFNVPKVLVGIEADNALSSGDGQKLQQAKKYYDEITIDDRNIIEELFSKIMINWKQPIQSKFVIIPTTGLQVDAPKTPLATTLGVGGVQALTTIVSDQTIQPDQKIAMLITIFGIDPIDANSMILKTQN